MHFEFKTFGMELHDYINKDYVTKQEIIEIKKRSRVVIRISE